MKLTAIFLILGMSIVFISCDKNKPVTACIELDSQIISAGSSITFTSCSENEWSYLWEIEGPDSAAENSLGWSDKLFTRQFDTKGSYKVKLTTYSDFSFLGESASDSTSFTIN